MSPRAWLPLAFVTGSLLLLVIRPFITNRLITSIRVDRLDVANDARVALSEFEGAFAEELIIASAGPGRLPSDSAERIAVIRRERSTQRALDSLIARLGGAPVAQLAALRAAERTWRAMEARGLRAPSEARRGERATVGREVIDAAEALHETLVGVSSAGRDRLRQLDRLSLGVTAGLASIALVAMSLVVALERRVRAFARQADDRARELERSVELRASLIHGVVHDVKNPLGAASGYAELLEEGVSGPLNEPQLEMVRRFKRLIATALQTVAELVDLARVDAGEYQMDARETNLVPTVRRIVDDHHARAMTKSITLDFNAPREALWLRTDPARVRHVVENLLSNALKYTPAGGAVRVTVDTAHENGTERARISVRDTGPGIPPEMRERIFDPFFRVSASEDRAPGSGLGLAISRRIAGLLGGAVAVTDAAGDDGRKGGSDFVFTLPITDPAAAERDSPAE